MKQREGGGGMITISSKWKVFYSYVPLVFKHAFPSFSSPLGCASTFAIEQK